MACVRVRFAPSPTGDLHIGGVRTALFNWLFAKKMNGKFILRIDDTDTTRSNESSVKIILDAMKWLKLDWDEGPGNENSKYYPYFQMERKKNGIYQKYADELIVKKCAYHCYCTTEEINTMKEISKKNKIPYKYDGRCKNLTFEEIKLKRTEGRTSVIRFKALNTGTIILNDLIKGAIKFNNSLIGDFVIIKANGTPTYNFACVVDDYLMKITHVLRGDDHISNTPKQIHIYNALNWKIPNFAHFSMILGPDRLRLSKRHGHTSVLKYRKDGYLYETLINYLALLGWSTENSQQIFAIDEIKYKFSIERCISSPSIFDPIKLLWINGEKIRLKSAEQIYELFIDWINYTGNSMLIKNWDVELLKKAISLERDKIKLLKDIPHLLSFFFDENIKYENDAIDAILLQKKSKNITKHLLCEILKVILNCEDFSAIYLEKCIRNLAFDKNIKTSQMFHSIRIAVSGRKKGPSLFHMMEVIGKKEVAKRINIMIDRFFS